MELSLVREVKDNMKGFLKSVNSKRKTWECAGLQLNEMSTMVIEGTKKAELLNAFFPSVLTAKTQESQTWEVRERVWRKEDSPFIKEDLVRGHLGKINAHKSVGPDGMYPGLLRDMAKVIAKLLSIIFEMLWRTEEVPQHWSETSVTPVFEKGKKVNSVVD